VISERTTSALLHSPRLLKIYCSTHRHRMIWLHPLLRCKQDIQCHRAMNAETMPVRISRRIHSIFEAQVSLTCSGKEQKASILPRLYKRGGINRIVFVSHAKSRFVVLLTNEDSLFVLIATLGRHSRYFIRPKLKQEGVARNISNSACDHQRLWESAMKAVSSYHHSIKALLRYLLFTVRF